MIVGLYIPLSSVISCIYLFVKESLVYAIVKFLAQKWIIIAYLVILIWLSSLMQRTLHHVVGCTIWWIAIIAHAAFCSIVVVSSQSDICSRIIIIAGSGISWFLIQEPLPGLFKRLFTLLIFKISMQILILLLIDKLDICERLLLLIYIAILSCFLWNYSFLLPLGAHDI